MYCYELDKANNVWTSSKTVLGKGRAYAAAVGGVFVNDRWWIMGGDNDAEDSKVGIHMQKLLLLSKLDYRGILGYSDSV